MRSLVLLGSGDLQSVPIKQTKLNSDSTTSRIFCSNIFYAY